ncbi:hypothetical protein L3Q82_026822 [Scortum barcoo]|uniref:Uncharacterized protein n=1 Tax=Scortum barcoo TaxID=214431 RepID=A0ACB8WJT2_9TELE|nr:hypothetical protein L3Q82_026822 [Scortum barcoo]
MRDTPVTRTIQQWNDQSDLTLCNYFSTTFRTGWCVFTDRDINTYTDMVICYIGKCIDDFVPRITVRTFPNQKPWVNGEDTHEFLSAVLEQMSSLSPRLQEVAAQSGRHYTCHCGAQTVRHEEFTNLSVDLIPGATTEDLLQEYTKTVVFVLFCRRQSWTSGVSVEEQHAGRAHALQLCQKFKSPMACGMKLSLSLLVQA